MGVKCPKCKRIMPESVNKKLTWVEKTILIFKNDKTWYDFMHKQLIKNLNKEKYNGN